MSDGGEKEVCGECKKVVGKNDKGVVCEQCELWFHCKCEKLHEDTYKLMGQDKIHFFCGRCDKAVGKLLKSVTTLQLRQDQLEADLNTIKMEMKEVKNEMVKKLEGKVVRVEEELKQVGGRKLVRHEEMEVEFEKIRVVLKEVSEGSSPSGTGNTKEVEIVRLQKEVGEMKAELETKVSTTCRSVKEDVEETLEIERRKYNLVIHGVPETDAEKDIDSVAEIMGEGLHLDFDRHVDKMMRIGRYVEGKSRPLRMSIKTLDGKREILSRAKELKDNEKFKRMYISPDLTRRQQEVDKDLRMQLKMIREEGETEARIRYGKIVKNLRGGREEVLYLPQSQK